MIQSILDGSKLEGMCILLDNHRGPDGRSAQPLAGWLEGIYEWPGSFVKAYEKRNRKERIFWHRRFTIYRNKIKKTYLEQIPSQKIT